MSGKLGVTLKETPESPPIELALLPGDCFVSAAGIHTIAALLDWTMVYEIKNGPYLGQAMDKEWTDS